MKWNKHLRNYTKNVNTNIQWMRLAQIETETASSRILTLVAGYISWDNNHYTQHTLCTCIMETTKSVTISSQYL